MALDFVEGRDAKFVSLDPSLAFSCPWIRRWLMLSVTLVGLEGSDRKFVSLGPSLADVGGHVDGS